MGATVERAAAMEAMRQQGVRLWFVCNDCLPLSHPEWFPPEVNATFKAWLGTIVQVADGIACISRTTEDELRRRMDVLQPVRQRPLRLGHFHLGADMPTDFAVAKADIAPDQAATLDGLRTIPSFLTVGTLEPRKGYAQGLEAFELLWERGEDVAWVIVGLPGWMTEVVQRRIRHHDEFGRRLLWFIGANDPWLEKLYATCTALLAPSEGEGFGLPLIEAARHSLPILCRDLPVFREVAGEHAMYFSGLDAESLASAISTWLDAWRSDAVPTTQGMHWITWAESARQLMGVVLGEATAAEPRQSS
jgi:glycosyltransferase involved in cell wall biosynthesis